MRDDRLMIMHDDAFYSLIRERGREKEEEDMNENLRITIVYPSR